MPIGINQRCPKCGTDLRSDVLPVTCWKCGHNSHAELRSASEKLMALLREDAIKSHPQNQLPGDHV